MQTAKINSVKVKPAPIKRIDPKLVKGADMFPNLYGNVFICAKKESGKTTVIWNVLKECADKDTRIIIFSSTLNKDATYKHIVDHFEKEGNTILTYTSIKDNGVDQLATIVEMLGEAIDDEEEESSDEEEVPILVFHTPKKKRKKRKPKKPKKPKKVAPEVIFVLDDLGKELRFPSVAELVKTNRHYKCKVIMSSQYMNDLMPESIRQLDYLLMFGGHDDKKLEMIHMGLDLSVPLDKFIEMYIVATKEKYGFMYTDVRKEGYRLTFDRKFLL